jgi:hypothetical protein
VKESDDLRNAGWLFLRSSTATVTPTSQNSLPADAVSILAIAIGLVHGFINGSALSTSARRDSNDRAGSIDWSIESTSIKGNL